MELKCLDQFTSSLVIGSLTLIACILRSEFLISVLKDTTDPKRNVDGYINILLYINLVAYVILGALSILLIYAIIKKRHVLMIPWLIAALVSVFSEVIFIIYILAKGQGKEVLLLLVGTVLALWIIWAIFSFYKIVREENRTNAENIQDYLYSAARKVEIY